MATTTINNPNSRPWVELSIPANTDTKVNLGNGGVYLFVFMGNATQSQIFTVMVGDTGNTTYTTYGSNTALTITGGTGASGVTLNSPASRKVYVMALNDAAPAKLA